MNHPTFDSIWTPETIQTVISETQSEVADGSNYKYLCLLSPTFEELWPKFKRELRELVYLWSPEELEHAKKHNLTPSDLDDDDCLIYCETLNLVQTRLDFLHHELNRLTK